MKNEEFTVYDLRFTIEEVRYTNEDPDSYRERMTPFDMSLPDCLGIQADGLRVKMTNLV